MRVVFEEKLHGLEPLSIDKLQRLTRKLERGRIVRSGRGAHYFDPEFPGGQFYLHEGRDDYRRVSDRNLRDLMEFPEGYSKINDSTKKIPEPFRKAILRFVAPNEREYLEVARERLPWLKLSEKSPEDAEVFAWGNLNYDRVRREAERRGVSIEQCIADSLPRVGISNGREFLHTPLRDNRPNGLEKEIFRSHYFGYYDGNPQAVADLLWSLVGARKLDADKRTIDSAVTNPDILRMLGVGSMIDGHGIILSLDTLENNKRFPGVLDYPLSPSAYARDLSSLGIEGVSAMTYTNRFQPFPRILDRRFGPHLVNLGYALGTGQGGIPLGIAAVTYSTTFGTDTEEKTPDGYFAMLTSQQLTGRRIFSETGWRNIAIVTGQNDGFAASSRQWHRQGYFIETEGFVPRPSRREATKDNELYVDGGVKLVALGYGHVSVQLQTDGDRYVRSFLDREPGELRSLAHGLFLTDLMMHRMGFKNRSEYTRGGDQAVRGLHPTEFALRTGLGEMALLRRFASSPETAVPVATSLPGNFNEFVATSRRTIHNFLYGK